MHNEKQSLANRNPLKTCYLKTSANSVLTLTRNPAQTLLTKY